MTKEKIRFGKEKRGAFFDEIADERPLLLYIHGGPLYPELFLIEKYYPNLLEKFQCVFPETRGSGLSASATQKNLEVNSLVEDIIDWAEYFLKKFNKEACLLMGHSFGTVTASLAVKERPDLFTAYIAIGQVNSMFEHSKIVYDFVKECCEKEEKPKFLQKFPNKADIDFTNNRDFYLFSNKYISKYRRAIFHKKEYNNYHMLKDLFSYGNYSLEEKFTFLSVLFSPKAIPLISEFMQETYSSIIGELEKPVFIFNGEYDLMTCPEQAKMFFNTIEAPYKKFYLYENSAHFPMFDESSRFDKDISRIIATLYNPKKK